MMASRKTFNPAALSGPVTYGPSTLPSTAFEPVYTDKRGEEAIEWMSKVAFGLPAEGWAAGKSPRQPIAGKPASK